MRQNNDNCPSITFIVPALNEENDIELASKSILDAIAEYPQLKYEIIFVNDGSSDRTGEIINEIAKRISCCRVISHSTNKGLAEAYKSALSIAVCDYIFIIPGDNVIPSKDIAEILNSIGEADIIFPYLTNIKLRYFSRRISSRMFTIIINILFLNNIKYFQSVISRRELLNNININTSSYFFLAEISIKLLQKSKSYIEVPINNTPSKKYNSVATQPKRLFGVLKDIFTVFFEVKKFSQSNRK